MQDSDTPIFDAVKAEQDVDDAIFLPFKTHEEFLAEHEHNVWLALVLSVLDDQQVHRPDKSAEVPTPRVVTDLTVEPVHSVNE